VSRANKIANILGVGIPVVAFVASIYLLWGRYVNGVDLATLAVAYFLTCLGISIGFHRLLTHRAYQTYRPVRYALAVLGSMAMQGPVIAWVADHRKHHNFSDEEGDPHSPHVGRGSGVLGAIRGLYHAHVGWLFSGENRADQEKYAKDLLTEPAMHRISRWFFWIVGLSLVLPFLAGWALTGRVGGGLQTMFWGGLIRIFALHHITFSVNSICHFIGRRRFQVTDESRNVWWLAPFSLGEAWHHNHHAFPSSAFHGLKTWEVDVSGWVIRGLESIGLAWKVVRISPELQARKLATR
jgi:stearoyl-CoA desaturase (delta-9 desaturase)